MYNTVQQCTAQFSSVQYSSAVYSTVQQWRNKKTKWFEISDTINQYHFAIICSPQHCAAVITTPAARHTVACLPALRHKTVLLPYTTYSCSPQYTAVWTDQCVFQCEKIKTAYQASTYCQVPNTLVLLSVCTVSCTDSSYCLIASYCSTYWHQLLPDS
jgi:hypothetical protein